MLRMRTQSGQNGIVPSRSKQAGSPRARGGWPVTDIDLWLWVPAPMISLLHKKILLGVTGGIAAYKAAELARLLRKQGAIVKVVMTDSAQTFITPLTFQALTGEQVHTRLLDPDAEAGMGHIELAKWADLVLVAPASANFLARLATGHADDLLTTLCLATEAIIAVAPAMNQAMWRNAATRHNCSVLAARGIRIWGPAVGEQACGDVGAGRMLEPADITQQVADFFEPDVLSGKTVVVTAGPTREPLDPVRYISNHSSGKMGYALAVAARDAGAHVILISGPTSLPDPPGVKTVRVETAQQMLTHSLETARSADIFIAAAAVVDYAPMQVSAQKIKKEDHQELQLSLKKNPDIVAAVAAQTPRPFVVGFAAETENLLLHAKNKLSRKNLDIVIANDVSDTTIGFNSDRNAVWIVDANGETAYPEQDKGQLAKVLVRDIAKRLEQRNSKASRGN